jgi:hypothetical protein
MAWCGVLCAPMRALVLLGGLIGGGALLVLTLSTSAVPPTDPTGTGLAPPPTGGTLAPLGYLTGVLMLIGGIAIFWFPVLASVALGLAAALGIGSGVMGDSQDQLMYGILAVFLTGVAVVVVVREGRRPDQVVGGPTSEER